MKYKWWLPCLLLFSSWTYAQEKSSCEWDKIKYTVEAKGVFSHGDYAPFWLTSNQHGLSSWKNNHAHLSASLIRPFEEKRGWDWGYGLELAGAWNYSSPFYIQQLYAEGRYGCWHLSIGSKQRYSEDKNPTLSGGGLTFSPNARPIPQIRFGIEEYETIPWWSSSWIHVKGHFSYGRYTDDRFQRSFTAQALPGNRYVQDVRFHEKTAFLKIGNLQKFPLSFEMGLEMYTLFGGKVWEKSQQGDLLRWDLPHGFMEYLKAFVPFKGGSDSPDMDQTNINGNVLGSWHFALTYEGTGWKIRGYYEHYYEDHSQLLGLAVNPDRNGKNGLISYFPWRDGLFGLEATLPQNPFVRNIVYEFITSRDQSGPILHNSNAVFPEQISGVDYYYNHTYYQSWQHWGMSMCNPHFLSPYYNKDHNLTMPYQRLISHHIGFDGTPSAEWDYRVLASWSRHWGSTEDPLPHPMEQLSLMGETTYSPLRAEGWHFGLSLAWDKSELIGNNIGGMITIRKEGWLTAFGRKRKTSNN